MQKALRAESARGVHGRATTAREMRGRTAGRTSARSAVSTATAATTSARPTTATTSAARSVASTATTASRARRLGHTALSVLLACSLAFTLSSCRESDALTEKVIGAPYEYETDYSLTPTAFDNPEAAQADRTSQRETEEALSEDTWEENQPKYSSEDTTTTEETRTTTESQTLSSDLEASEGSTQTDEGGEDSTGGTLADGGTQSSGEQDDSSSAAGGDEETSRGQTIVVNSSGSSSGSQQGGNIDTEDDEQESQEETWNPGTSSSSSNGGGSSTTGGTYVEGDITSGYLPYVNSIAAAGPYATIVQALGGAGALAACNSDWYDALADEAFNYKSELSGTTVISAWGDGTSMNQEIFDAIVASGAEAVITSDTYGGITQKWADAFNDAGVNVVELPNIGIVDATDADIELCVVAIGAMLARAGTNIANDADGMADLWVELHDAVLSDTVNANGGYTTYLIDGYTSDVLMDGNSGLFATNPSATYITQSSSNRYYTVLVDSVTDESGTYTSGDIGAGSERFRSGLATGSGGVAINFSGSVWPCDGSWIPGALTGADPWYDFAAWMLMEDYFTVVVDGVLHPPISSGLSSSNFAVLHYYFQHSGVIDSSLALAVSTRLTEKSMLGRWTLWTYPDSSRQTLIVLGDAQFPGLVVRNDSKIIETIQASALIADSSSLTYGLYNLGQTYELYVVPDGIDGVSWIDGTFESFLAAPWIYCLIQGGATSNTALQVLSDCTTYLNDFYSTFYRCGSAVAAENGYGEVIDVVCNLG